MSRIFTDMTMRNGLALAAKLRIGRQNEHSMTDLTRDELLVYAAFAMRELQEIRAAAPYTTRVSMAANEDHAA